MDEMKISSAFARRMVAKMIRKGLKKGTGYDIDIDLKNIYISIDDSNVAHIHLDANAKIQKNDLEKIVDSM